MGKLSVAEELAILATAQRADREATADLAKANYNEMTATEVADRVLNILTGLKNLEHDFAELMPERAPEASKIFRSMYGKGAQLLMMSCQDEGRQLELPIKTERLGGPYCTIPSCSYMFKVEHNHQGGGGAALCSHGIAIQSYCRECMAS